MQSNRVLWSNRNLIKPSLREQGALEFIYTIQESSPGFDFASIAKEFSNLPEINVFDKKFPELSPPAKKVFQKIYSINAKNPEVGLKIITILACNVECAFYTPKLKEIVFLRLNEWLLSEEMPRRNRLEWGLFCWKNWPVRHSKCDKNEFVEPLLKLFIDEASDDAEYTLKIYDNLFERRSDNSYIFNQFREDPEDFLLFARNVQHVRPQFLIDALMKFIRDGKRGYGGYKAELGKLELACSELFDISENHNLTTEQHERILRELILYSYPELPWYNQLHGRLWEIEKSKLSQDKLSNRNHLIASINAPRGSESVPSISQSYKQWINSYKDQEWLSIKNVIGHSKEMLELINFSLNAEHPITRNKSFIEPNNSQLIDITIKSFWEMVEYLKVYDFELYLYALETAMEKPTFTVDVTDDIGNRSKQLLLTEFEEYCFHNIEKASLLVTYMISRSGYTEIKIHIREVLGIIYPILFSINANVAKAALKEGVKGEFGHMRLWRPRA